MQAYYCVYIHVTSGAIPLKEIPLHSAAYTRGRTATSSRNPTRHPCIARHEYPRNSTRHVHTFQIRWGTQFMHAGRRCSQEAESPPAFTHERVRRSAQPERDRRDTRHKWTDTQPTHTHSELSSFNIPPSAPTASYVCESSSRAQWGTPPTLSSGHLL